MASRVCWSCGTYAHMTPVEGTGQRVDIADRYNDLSRKQAVFTCDECRRMSIGEAIDTASVYSGQVESYLATEAYDLDWFPERGTSRAFPDTPDHIAQAATEATHCLNLGAYRAAGALARAVVEATAKECGVEGQLFKKIEAMSDKGLIREHIKEAAHEVRHFGNGMAHGDFVDAVTREEAEEVVGLMEEVLAEVFQSPAKVERRRAARLAKRSEDAK